MQVSGRHRIVVDPDGSMWKEVTRSTGNSAGIATGLTVFLGSYAITAVVGQLRGNAWGWWPIFGGFLGAIGEKGGSHNEENGLRAGWIVSGFIQMAGFITSLASIAGGPKKVVRYPLRFGPMGLSGTF